MLDNVDTHGIPHMIYSEPIVYKTLLYARTPDSGSIAEVDYEYSDLPA